MDALEATTIIDRISFHFSQQPRLDPGKYSIYRLGNLGDNFGNGVFRLMPKWLYVCEPWEGPLPVGMHGKAPEP